MITLFLGVQNCFSYLQIIQYLYISFMHFKRAKKEQNRHGDAAHVTAHICVYCTHIIGAYWGTWAP